VSTGPLDREVRQSLWLLIMTAASMAVALGPGLLAIWLMG
jgi:hypothetical protein